MTHNSGIPTISEVELTIVYDYELRKPSDRAGRVRQTAVSPTQRRSGETRTMRREVAAETRRLPINRRSASVITKHVP